MPQVDDFNRFIKDQNVAMMPVAYTDGTIQNLVKAEKETGLQYDFVAHPVFADVNQLPFRTSFGFTINPNSEHIDEAFLVAANMAFNLELATQKAREGFEMAYENPELMKVFGVDSPIKNKNLAAVTFHKKIGYAPTYEFSGDGMLFWKREGIPAIIKGKDINTVLREMDEKTNQKLQQQIAASNKAK